MANKLHSITNDLKEFMENQKIFFVATAMKEGTINLSPKGLDSLKVLDENTVLWQNLTGSGNETATHLEESNRMTIMFCAFEGKPLILRLYGTCKAIHPRDEEFTELASHFEPNLATRQMMLMHVDLVQTSCGYAVPLMEYKEDRTILNDWSEKQGKERIEKYWEDKNSVSLDGHQAPLIKE